MSTSTVGLGTLSVIGSMLEDRYYYPFSGRVFEFNRATHMDLMRLSTSNIKIISELKKDWKNILKYEFEIEQYDGKIPTSFNKIGCFIIGFKDFAMCCYIDIEKLDCNICAVFDVVQYID